MKYNTYFSVFILKNRQWLLCVKNLQPVKFAPFNLRQTLGMGLLSNSDLLAFKGKVSSACQATNLVLWHHYKL